MARNKELFQDKTTTLYSCLCCCCAFPLLIAAFAVVCAAYSSQKEFSDNFQNLGGNWKQDVVVGISNTDQIPLKEGQYVDRWQGNYPGTVDGCFCSSSAYYWRVSAGMKTRSCNWNETRAGCREIPSTPAKTLPKWINSQEVFVIRQRNTSFMETYSKLNQDGSCVEGFKNCGNKNTKSKGFCIPNSVAECPITDISSDIKPGYQQVAFLGFVLFTSRSADNNPVIDTIIRESHLCYSRQDFGVTPGRKRYELLKGDYANCIKDDSGFSLGDIGEVDLFDINGVDYKGLINYSPDNKYRYRLLASRVTEWSPVCNGLVKDIAARAEDSKSLDSTFFSLYVIYIVTFIIALFCFIRIVYVFAHENKKTGYCLVFGLRIILFIVILPSLFSVNSKCNSIIKFVSDISTKDCSTPPVNNMFRELSVKFNGSVVTLNKWAIALAFIEIAVEFIMLLVAMKAIGESDGFEGVPGGPGSAEMAGTYQPVAQPGPNPAFNPYGNQNSPYLNNQGYDMKPGMYGQPGVYGQGGMQPGNPNGYQNNRRPGY
jgi:hypothetical protein